MTEQTSAGQALEAAAIEALAAVDALNGRYEGPPLQAAFPYAIVEAGPESDWSHKNGLGRELRLMITLRDKGERPARLRRLLVAAEGALAALSITGDWRLVTLTFLRSRLVPEGGGVWAGVIEYRARLLAGTP